MTEAEVELIYDYLHENYVYRDGELIRRKCNTTIYGSINGNSKKLLFSVSFRVKNKKYNWSYGHLIYLYHHKIKPDYLIEIDGNPTNYRIENLKSVDHSQMMKQCDLQVKNKHGLKGVYQDNKRFAARLWLGKKYKYISWHNTPEEAHAAYLKAKEEYSRL
jgi:hypothetical protein